MKVEVLGEVWFWKGPAPHHFVTVPEGPSREIKGLERSVTYGWGMIPARVTLGGSTWETALFPKDGLYVVPLRLAVRRREGVQEGDTVALRLEIGAK